MTLTPHDIQAIEQAKRRVHKRSRKRDFDPATAAEQLRQLEALQRVPLIPDWQGRRRGVQA